jgi:hypothetical protein
MLSGFGEASLQCSAPPWIQQTALPSQRGTWLSIYYTAISVGSNNTAFHFRILDIYMIYLINVRNYFERLELPLATRTLVS